MSDIWTTQLRPPSLATHGSARGATHQLAVLGQHAPGILGRWWGESEGTLSKHLWGQIDVEGPCGHVETDRVTVLHEGDGTAVDRLRSDMADTQTGRASGEPAIGQQQDLLTQASALDGARDSQHLAHAWTTLGPFVTDNHHLARLERAAGHGVHRRALAVEDSCGSFEDIRVKASRLHHSTLRRQRPAQNRQAAGLVDWLGHGT